MTVEKVNNKTADMERRTERRTFWWLWCSACARLVNMATIERAASLTGLSVELLIERLNRRSLHSLKKQSGNQISARFWDVPKGKAKGSGEITLEKATRS